MWEYYDSKAVLVTGGSGCLGTAIAYRLLTRSSISHIYVLCRGGLESVESKWRQWVPDVAEKLLCDKSRLSVLQGDLLLPRMGLSEAELETLRDNVNIVIHAGSSINLAKPLPGLSQPIIGASESVARFALTCKKLDRFVYVSTAYANSHLHSRAKARGSDVAVEEEFHGLKEQLDAVDEWCEVQKNGTSAAYEAEDFPWAYAYAKHLSERLLRYEFGRHGAGDKLLVIRPSIVGPAQKFPFPGYSMPMSTPSTMLAAAMALTPSRTVGIATHMTQPETEAFVDEVPVDVVVDRLLTHLALGSNGCVHAVAGKRARMIALDWWYPALALRRIPWGLHVSWIREDWKTPKQHWVSRLYVILGTSFAFSEDRTIALSDTLREKERLELELFTRIHLGDQLLERKDHVWYAMTRFAERSWWAWLALKMFYSEPRASNGIVTGGVPC